MYRGLCRGALTALGLIAPVLVGTHLQMEGGHPDHSPGIAWEGLNWQPAPADHYLAQGTLCVGDLEQHIGGPLPSGASILANWTHLPGPTGGVRTGHVVLEQAEVPPHDAQLCRKIKAVDQTVLADEVRCEVTVYVNGQFYWGETFIWTVKVCGGPVEISVAQRASGGTRVDEGSLIRERVYDTTVLGENWQRPPIGDKWPWYCTDFNFNPFYYRNDSDYSPAGFQQINVFEAKVKWTQPQETQIRFSLSGDPGVLLNPDADLEVLQGGGPNPHGTKRLAWDKVAKIAARDDMPGNPFALSAGYFIPPEPPPGAEVNPLATDDSGQWYKKHPEDSGFPLNPGRDDPSILDPYGDQDPELYTLFSVHRPATVVPYPSSMGWTPPQPPPGTTGVALLYVLTDTEGFGMPGVQIQERFWLGIPPGFSRNVWIYWKTVQKGEKIEGVPEKAVVDGVMGGPDYLWVVNEYVPFELDGHEYWAATTRTGYDVWVNPETGAREYYGIKVKCFKIVISLTFQGHQDGQNCSPATPPPD